VKGEKCQLESTKYEMENEKRKKCKLPCHFEGGTTACADLSARNLYIYKLL